jgi:hypothetical protein
VVTKLSPGDLERFFKLYHALHLYANERVQVLPEVRSREDMMGLSVEDRTRLRDALYDHPELFGQFGVENPAGLTAEDLLEVKSWSAFISGDFYIVRHLKRYSVLLTSGQNARAYGVVGLSDSIDDRFPGYSLPVYVKAVLLPFQGRIIWDGLVLFYNVTFGPGIRGDLNETYQRIKQREGIIESLTSPVGAIAATIPKARHRKAQLDPRPIVQRIAEASEQLRPGATPLQSRTFSLLRAATRLAEAATNEPTDLAAIHEQMRTLSRAYKQLATAYDREVHGDFA